MPRSRAAADFYNMASSCFDIVSNITPSPIKVNINNKSDCVCVAEPTDINLDELKDFMDGQIEEIKGNLLKYFYLIFLFRILVSMSIQCELTLSAE